MIEQAVILCGGRGSRLGALTTATPKPLLPVGEAPFLDVLLFELGRHGIRRILLLAGFAAPLVAEYAAATALAARFGLTVEVAVEPEEAGTGGALWHARRRLDDVFLLLNGDSWFDINLLDLAIRLARDPAAPSSTGWRRMPRSRPIFSRPWPSKAGCAALSSIAISSISGCPRISPAPATRSRSAAAGRRRFSTATAC